MTLEPLFKCCLLFLSYKFFQNCSSGLFLLDPVLSNSLKDGLVVPADVTFLFFRQSCEIKCIYDWQPRSASAGWFGRSLDFNWDYSGSLKAVKDTHTPESVSSSRSKALSYPLLPRGFEVYFRCLHAQFFLVSPCYPFDHLMPLNTVTSRKMGCAQTLNKSLLFTTCCVGF